MFNKSEIIAVLSGVAILAIAYYGTSAKSPKVEISVAFGTNSELVLTIKNPTTNIVIYDDPRLNSSPMLFDWELFSGRDIIAKGGRVRMVLEPLVVGHRSGPVDIWASGPMQMNLPDFYPELTKTNLGSKANLLMWYCRVWDMTATNWIQACGALKLKPITQ